ncbi:MAG TPA: hypothetical protein PKD26_14180 [Pyrinomonadaceae bacterium]|nr:hypothetical protein [Pyrinomonadaceae bacterium]
MPKDGAEFNGRVYALRLIDFGEGWGNYFVGSMHLEYLLINEDHSYTSDEARHVDELIFYFIPVHYFKLSDDELRDKILEEIG